MKIRRHSKDYNFFGDTETGLTMRWGDSINTNPEYAPWPELADISISNHCTKGCEFCYKGSTNNNSFMTIEQYEHVLSSLQSEKWGNVFQVALGGGEPLEHPNFIDIINITNEKGIVANFTTNGIHLNEDIVNNIKNKIGAVAISVNKIEELNTDKMKLLMDAGIKTNIHFVLDNRSIYEGIDILSGKYNDLLKGVNGVIFLTYKPKGRAGLDKCLDMDDVLNKFISLIDSNMASVRIGFDACFVPLLMKDTKVNVDYIDSCECGFFSVYIDEEMNVQPCSFANDDRFSYNLKNYDFNDIWTNKYSSYRNDIMQNNCKNECTNKSNCRGKCVYYDSIAFCYI
ncbi:radical SAM protein [Clostridium sp.]|uniref:radical SAM protein n=1 Tax=Clostridium sp. TaxID=1506 RepID=UPI00284EA232|nr:radical SAM protein [Clostridium sp.]MDR3595245.1 radical SAM protein [Clostridium sp.]